MINPVGPGIMVTGNSSANARRTAIKPGSAIPGVPASVTTATDLPSRSRPFDGLALVVFVERNLRFANVKMFEQTTGFARVFAGDKVHGAQSFQSAQGDVVEVANGCCYEIEHGLSRIQNTRYDFFWYYALKMG
jgi:hypothetical protein